MRFRQVGALPFRRNPTDGSIEVLLVTSRRTSRWIVPKGNIDSGREARAMAVTEAFEEAGVSGALLDRPLGIFEYDKVLPDGTVRPSEVELFALAVTQVHKNWPENGERQRQWYSIYEASEIVEEAELAALILVFGTLPPDE